MMRSHRLALATLAAATSLLAAGCGTGRDTEAFLPAGSDPATPVAEAPPAPAPVVVGAPDAAAAPEPAAGADRALTQAERERRAARRELREERGKARRARKRAAAREAFLREALSSATRRKTAAKKPAAPASGSAPASEPSAPITASDVSTRDLVAERNRRSDAEARAAVIRFHELLDRRDVRACSLLTPALLEAVHGSDRPLERCHEAVAAITADVSVQISESRAHGARAAIAVVSRWGDNEVAQTLRLVLENGTWLIHAVERRQGS